MRAGLHFFAGQGLADDRGRNRLHRHGEDRLATSLLDVAGHAGEGAAGSHAGHQHIHGAIGVVPDFRAGGLFVDRRVGRVLELLQQQVLPGVGGHQLVGLLDGAFHALGRLGQHQFGAQGFEHLAPLQAHGRRHGEDQLVATGGGDEGQADAGVAGGGLYQGHARLEAAGGFGIPDHAGADAALHRIGGVAALDLGEDGHTVRPQVVDAHQGRVADGLRVVGEDAAHGGILVMAEKGAASLRRRPGQRPALAGPERGHSCHSVTE
ncbi:hypothetical protein D9M71_386000 [compost metagenome]